jgi:hypothetical protein
MKDGGRGGLEEDEGWRKSWTGRECMMEEDVDLKRMKNGGRGELEEDEGWRKIRTERG